MNELKIFENKEFGQIRAIEKDGGPWLVGKDIALSLGYSNTNDALLRHVDDEDRAGIAIHDGRQERTMVCVNESGLYSLILGSKLSTAKKFKRWVTNDVLPSIRKHGAYMTPEKLEEVLLNPDTLIRLATDLKTEREKRLQAERQLEHKTEVIKGVTDDVDIYTKRNVLNKVVRYKGANFAERWNELYERFREVYSIDLKARCEGYNLKQQKKKDQLSVIKYAEQFGYLDKLYKIALKLYETDINEILKHLQKIA